MKQTEVREVRKPWLLIGTAVCGVIFFIALQILFPLLHLGFGPEKVLLPIIISPAAKVEETNISYRRVISLARDMQLLNTEMAKDAALTEALTLAIQQRRIELLAQELGVDGAEGLAEGDPALQPYVDAGWSDASIMRFVRKPQGLLLAVSAAVFTSPQLQESGMVARDSLMQKLTDGMPFVDVATRFSDDPSATVQGDLDYLNEQEAPEWMRPAFLAEPYEPLFAESEAAFWILQREGEVVGTDGVLYVRIRGIAVLKRTLSDVLAERASEHPAEIYVW
jgi:hypothetical protein